MKPDELMYRMDRALALWRQGKTAAECLTAAFPDRALRGAVPPPTNEEELDHLLAELAERYGSKQ